MNRKRVRRRAAIAALSTVLLVPAGAVVAQGVGKPGLDPCAAERDRRSGSGTAAPLDGLFVATLARAEGAPGLAPAPSAPNQTPAPWFLRTFVPLRFDARCPLALLASGSPATRPVTASLARLATAPPGVVGNLRRTDAP